MKLLYTLSRTTRALSLIAAAFMAQTLYADDWMARLSDGIYFNQLSIPGAHDSGTGHGTSMDTFARTQDGDISAQWAAGVRAFDLRPTVVEDYVNINHGIIQTNVTFERAISILRDSVAAHPTEFAVVLMRHESDAESSTENAQWPAKVGKVLTDPAVAPYIQPFSRSLTVYDLRGHILVLSRDDYQGSKGGIISGWSHSSAYADQKSAKITAPKGSVKTTLYCQDFYDVTSSGGSETKKAAVETMLNFSTQQHLRTNYIWIINHTSGYTKTLFGAATMDGYRDNAATQNTAVINYLQDEEHYGPTGIIVMDFATSNKSGDYNVNGLKLTRAIIENNFKYSPREDLTVGIQRLDTDADEPASSATVNAGSWFDISGKSIARPSHSGLYLLRTASGATRKVIIR